MALSLISTPVFYFLNFFICVAYPALNTFAYLYKEEFNKLDNNPIKLTILSQPSHALIYAHFILYWLIYVVFAAFEKVVKLSVLSALVPFYYEVRLLLFFWLGSSYYKGSGYLYLTYLREFINNALVVLDRKLELTFGTQALNQIKDIFVSIAFLHRPSALQSSNGTSGGSSSPRSRLLFGQNKKWSRN